MKHAVMVCADYPDVRCGRITQGMKEHGWTHDVLTRGFPAQMEDAYDHIYASPFQWKHTFDDSTLYHVHGELHSFWPVERIKETSNAKVILNVHDLTCARPNSQFDKSEEAGLSLCDAQVWTTEEQRAFATKAGLDTSKPYCIVPNYVSRRYFIDSTPLPHIGGICYEGGISPRGDNANSRDFSPIADALDGELFIYRGGNPVGYGIERGTVFEYPLLFHRLAQHDWGLAGFYEAHDSWTHASVTKAYEYLAAGIPIISFNTPQLDPVTDLGMGVKVDNLQQLRELLDVDVTPYKEAVLKHRSQFCVERTLKPLAELYERLTDV